MSATSAKKAWPLLVLAGCSLIPLLGIFAGFVAVCWGLITDRPRGILAASLGAAGMLLNIGGLALIGFSVLAKDPKGGGALALVARTELDTLAVYIEAYKAETGRYPADLAVLRGRKSRMSPLPDLDHSVSLFNVSTHYLYRLTESGAAYRVFGAGRDGLADTADDIVPTLGTAAGDATDSSPPDSAIERPD